MKLMVKCNIEIPLDPPFQKGEDLGLPFSKGGGFGVALYKRGRVLFAAIFNYSPDS